MSTPPKTTRWSLKDKPVHVIRVERIVGFEDVAHAVLLAANAKADDDHKLWVGTETELIESVTRKEAWTAVRESFDTGDPINESMYLSLDRFDNNLKAATEHAASLFPELLESEY